MKLSDMTAAEKKAFGSLIRVMIGADREFSDAEASHLASFARELGPDEFRQMVEEAGGHPLDESEVKAEVQSVTRKEVQETIYGVLFGIAAAGAIDVRESRLLDWVTEIWDLDTMARAYDEAKTDG